MGGIVVPEGVNSATEGATKTALEDFTRMQQGNDFRQGKVIRRITTQPTTFAASASLARLQAESKSVFCYQPPLTEVPSTERQEAIDVENLNQ